MTVPELAPGQIVAQRYTVRGQLGRSERVATYEAVTAPAREVVLKVYDASLRERPAAMDALQRIVALESGLSDAQVVRTLEVVFDPATGSPIVVSELCSWPSLAQLVELCPLALPDAVTMLQHLADVLEAAAARTLLHLSLHPGNVFVGAAPQWAVRVGDFVAQATRGAADDADPYLAPELRAEGGAPTGAADVYAAAVLFHFALTRATLTPEQAVVGASRRAEAAGVAVDPRVDAVLARAMATDPAARHATVRELALAMAQAVGLGAPRSIAAPPMPEAAAPVAPPLAPPPLAPAGPRPRMPTQVAFPAPQAAAAAPAPELLDARFAAPTVPDMAPPSVPPPPAFLEPLPPPLSPSIFDDLPPAQPPTPAAPLDLSAPAVPVMVHVEASAPAPVFGAFTPAEADMEPLPVTARNPRARRRLVAVLAGFAAAAVLGIGVAAMALRHGSPAPVTSAASVTAPPPATTAAPPEASSVAAVEPAPSATASAASSAEPAPAASVAAADTPDAAAEAAPSAPKGTSLYVTCEPACEEVRIDGFTISKKDAPFSIKPGYHMLLVRKTGYGTQIRQVVAVRNKETTIHVQLSRAATTTTPHHKKPCGKFLERCD